ncbi:MAG: hypothetical protein ACKPKO_16740, partial [Candidatus Fonsibacter sp.]
RWSILLDFGNKADDASHSGLDHAKKLNMDQNDAHKQKTPSGGLHYIFYVDAQHKGSYHRAHDNTVSGRRI